MRFFYSLGINIYTSVIFIAALFNRKANLMIKGRRDAKIPDFGSDDVIWIHAASLGEFEQGKPLIEKLKKDYAQFKIVLTFFSPSGYEVRKNYELVNHVSYIPFDSKKNASKFLDKLKPKLVIFIKYEFWFNFLIELKRREIPVVFVSAIFRDHQIYFKPIGKWFLKHLLRVTHFFVQNKHSQDVLIRNNINKSTVTGDTRFDSVLNTKNTNFISPNLDSFLSGSKFIVFGSTWSPDEELIIKFINSGILRGFKFIIAPHEISSQKVEQIQKNIKVQSALYTEQFISSKNQVLVVNQIGQLKYLYRYADLAYVGGGFGAGIHNTLEAAVYGCPVVFGPKYQKFDEAKKMVKLKIGFSIMDYQSFERQILFLLRSDQIKIKFRSEHFFKESKGASSKVILYLKEQGLL